MEDNAGGQAHDEGLVDVTGIPLAQLLPSDDTALTNSLRRLVAEMDHPHDIIAAFQNYAR